VLLPPLKALITVTTKIVNGFNTVIGVFKDVDTWTTNISEEMGNASKEMDRASQAAEDVGKAGQKAAAGVKQAGVEADAAAGDMQELTNKTKEAKKELGAMGKFAQQLDDVDFDLLSDEAKRQSKEALKGLQEQASKRLEMTRAQIIATREELENMPSQDAFQRQAGRDRGKGRDFLEKKMEKRQKLQQKLNTLQDKQTQIRSKNNEVTNKLQQAMEAEAKFAEQAGVAADKSASHAERRAAAEKKTTKELAKQSKITKGPAFGRGKDQRTFKERQKDDRKGDKLTKKIQFAKKKGVAVDKVERGQGGELRVPMDPQKTKKIVDWMDQIDESVKEQNKHMQKNAQAAAQLTSELGTAVGQLGQAAGLSSHMSNTLKKGIKGVAGMIGPLGTVVAESWSFATAMSVATAGLSAVAGLAASGASQLPSGPGAAGGGPAAGGARSNRDQKRFADMLAERIGEEVREREKRQIVTEIDARGALVGSEREVARKMTDLIEQDLQTRESTPLARGA